MDTRVTDPDGDAPAAKGRVPAAKREALAAKGEAFTEDCAPRRVLELFSAKWTSHVLHAMQALYGGTCRPGALQRALPGLSKKMLTQTLRELERDGLVAREVHHVVPPRVDYSLTPLGRTMIEPIEMLYAWARDHEAELSALGLRAPSRRRKA
ncbi:transcriptional regulator [Lichenibacterium minor]|uniref:Transcriptional regulator n=1 Tax=Lichenibacterium minor TaxID=2316528 RepID=A0A4Q2UBQ8_9HYPH|nr:helix-turn-helix domain-containing protein [Lichenibacterium minor]RYC32295.1 transcriptional regulator [Lichenibacterium minor]